MMDRETEDEAYREFRRRQLRRGRRREWQKLEREWIATPPQEPTR